MPCYHPLTAYRFPGVHVHASGKPKLVFKEHKAQELLREHGDVHDVVVVPCSRCIGCRLRRASEWATRCVHEARYYDKSCFLTLTYDKDHLPTQRVPIIGTLMGTLVPKHYQDFAKRLRQHCVRNLGIKKLKYYMCGEYGEKRGRPHYHAVVFGYDPDDKVQVPNNHGAGDPIYESDELARLWSHGAVRIGAVTAASAGYVARYTLKKVYGEQGEQEYLESGRVPPYTRASKRLGRDYYKEYSGDMYPSDFLVAEESYSRIPVPRYYDKVLERENPELHAEVKKKRTLADRPTITVERMSVMEQCAELRVARLRRDHEQANVCAPGQEGAPALERCSVEYRR